MLDQAQHRGKCRLRPAAQLGSLGEIEDQAATGIDDADRGLAIGASKCCKLHAILGNVTANSSTAAAVSLNRSSSTRCPPPAIVFAVTFAFMPSENFWA